MASPSAPRSANESRVSLHAEATTSKGPGKVPGPLLRDVDHDAATVGPARPPSRRRAHPTQESADFAPGMGYDFLVKQIEQTTT